LSNFLHTISKKILGKLSQRKPGNPNWALKPWLVNPGTKGTLANTTGCKEFNLFTGMAHNYDPAFEVDTNKFNLLTNHLLEVWCGGNIEHHNWLLSWLANIIQHPQQKIGIAVVLHSEASLWNGLERSLAKNTTPRSTR